MFVLSLSSLLSIPEVVVVQRQTVGGHFQKKDALRTCERLQIVEKLSKLATNLRTVLEELSLQLLYKPFDLLKCQFVKHSWPSFILNKAFCHSDENRQLLRGRRVPPDIIEIVDAATFWFDIVITSSAHANEKVTTVNAVLWLVDGPPWQRA